MLSVRKILLTAVAVAYAAAASAQDASPSDDSQQDQARQNAQAEMQKLGAIGRKRPNEWTADDKKTMNDYLKKYRNQTPMSPAGSAVAPEATPAAPTGTGGANEPQAGQLPVSNGEQNNQPTGGNGEQNSQQ